MNGVGRIALIYDLQREYRECVIRLLAFWIRANPKETRLAQLEIDKAGWREIGRAEKNICLLRALSISNAL